MTSSPEVLAKHEYNTSYSLNISIYISSHQNSIIVYSFMGVVSSLIALVGSVIILLALRRCSCRHSSLVISDLAIALVGQPWHFVYLLAIAWNNPRLCCAVGLPHSLLTTFLGAVSFWTLTVKSCPGQIPCSSSSSSLRIPLCREVPSHCSSSHHLLVVPRLENF